MNAAKEIETLIRAKYPILFLVTWEEARVQSVLEEIGTRLNRQVHTWSVTQGMNPPVSAARKDQAGKLPGELEALAQIHEAPEFTIFVLKDFHSYMRDTRVIRLMRDLALRLRGKSQSLIVLSPNLTIPTELEKEITVVEYPLPGAEEIASQLDDVISAVSDNPQFNTDLEPLDREIMIKSAQGLTKDEIESAFARSLVEFRRFNVETILEEKKQIVRKSGLLEFYPAESSFKDVGGHDLLKEWLEKRRTSFTDKAREFGLPAPKGVLMLGVQGCGKSLVAKSIAATWHLPLLKLDVGRIFGSLVGQSEENIRKAIRVAESVSPCCLWADELEKGFAGVAGGGSGDSGTTQRVFATFLTWMQEKTKPVFLIATANDVSKLPPELLRKGRFDDIFFIDLPEGAEREEIFAIHIKKRKRDLAHFDLKELAQKTAGFSGAEIEQVVIGGLFNAYDKGHDLTQLDLVHEAEAQVPLSVMMAEEIDELRTWARLRARPSARRTEN